jgi:ABC transport system ATP-binding/permease protein
MYDWPLGLRHGTNAMLWWAVPAIVTVQNVEKSFGTRRVLAGVSFALGESDRVGLVGLNGAGKSTLLKLVADPSDAPDAGLVTRMRGLTIEYVPQEPRLDGALTVRETVRSGVRALPDDDHELGKLEAEVRGLSAALELPPAERAVATLSGGERRRVALARALISRPALLALDEPTNHLDTDTVAWLEQRLREQEGALILVTHDRYFLDNVVTRILEIDRGKLFAYEGGYTAFLEKQAERLANEAERERQRAAFVRRELDWIRRGPKARTTKQQARIDRFDSAVAAAPGEQRSGAMALRLPTGGRLGKTILELRGATKRRTHPLFTDLTLVMKPGDRIGVVGPNGAGKTTLIRCVVGEEPLDSGEIVRGVNTRIAWLDQARGNLRDDKTVLQEVAGDGDHVVLEGGPVHARTFLRMMLFDDGFADTPVGSLSGGERNRVQLAKLLRSGGNLLVLDEPTNDLDLMTLGVLEDALQNFAGCALVVSHDRWFLDKVATGILAFEGDGRVTFYEGNYQQYLERRPKPAAAAAVEKKAPPAPKPPTKKFGYKEQRELQGMEPSIEQAEARVAGLQAALNDPATYRERAADVAQMVKDLDAARAEVERLYARWQELEALKK